MLCEINISKIVCKWRVLLPCSVDISEVVQGKQQGRTEEM